MMTSAYMILSMSPSCCLSYIVYYSGFIRTLLFLALSLFDLFINVWLNLAGSYFKDFHNGIIFTMIKITINPLYLVEW